MNQRLLAAAILTVVVSVPVFFFAPVVHYSQQVSIPNNFEENAYRLCLDQVTGQNSTYPNLNSTQFQAYNSCLAMHEYPPLDLVGYSSISYRWLGVGTEPYPSQAYFTQGQLSALVFFQGGKVTSGFVFSLANATLNPKDTVKVLNASVAVTGYGNLVFTATVENVSPHNLTSVKVDALGLPGPPYMGFLGSPTTVNGVAWNYNLIGSECSPFLMPGRVCVMSVYLGNPPLSGRLNYDVEVTGLNGGSPFLYGARFTQLAPEQGLGKDWISFFMGAVGGSRGAPLHENATLDQFASQRFETAATNPQISDYGLAQDISSFFGRQSSNLSVTELLLFPGSASPYLFATELQASAPHHWSALVDPGYTQFGYYFGQAPYYDVSANCPVTEVTGAGVNITQYFKGYGCTVTANSGVPWLVVVLSR